MSEIQLTVYGAVIRNNNSIMEYHQASEIVTYRTKDLDIGWIISIIVPSLLATLGCYLWSQYLSASKDSNSSLPLPPGSFGLPFLGETLHFLLECTTGEFFKTRTARYGRIFKTHILGKPTVMIAGPENVKKILLGEHSVVTSIWPPSFQAVLGDRALSMLDPHNHRVYKKIALRAFHHSRLSLLLPKVQRIIKEGLSSWDARTVYVYDQIKDITFRSSSCVFIGLDPSDRELKEMGEDFNNLTKGLFTLPINMPGTGFFSALGARKRLHKRIASKLTGDSCDVESIVPAIRNLCENHQLPLDDKSVTSIAVELLLGGQETSTSALTCAIMLLGQNQHVVSQLRQELRRYGLLEDSSCLKLETIQTMPCLNNVMKEVFRMYPPIPGGYRKVLKTFEVDGFQVPVGWNVTYSVKDTHDMAPIFEEPDIFNPDRWYKLKDNKVVSCNYLPFGAGARACVGKEYGRLFFRVFLIELIRTFDWQLLNPNPKMSLIPTVRPQDKLPVDFSRRETL